MFLNRIVVNAAVFTLVSISGARVYAASTPEEGTRVIPSRTLPVPNTVSPPMQELLKHDYHFPVPRTIEEWRQFAGGTLTEHATLAQQEQLAALSA